MSVSNIPFGSQDIGTVSAESETNIERPQFTGLLGTAGLAFAFLVVALAVIDHSQPLSFMPASWHWNRALWYLMALTSLIAGFALLRADGRRTRFAHKNQPALFRSVVLYTRKGCHLCDDAFDILRQFRQYLPAIEQVDIDTDPVLAERFDTCVPVVEFDGKVRFRGKVNPVLLQRLIDVELSRSRDD